ncbi:MAG: hypothetical protein D6705_00405 [Deltaproteobacteria bacterium]|nr:MAG: hypothetical protein D6705_00405 [Deltaproteobacteria bacterium]
MAQVAFARAGTVLFHVDEGHLRSVPRIGEVVVVDDVPHDVVDVEYWARPIGSLDRRTLVATVHLRPIDAADWELRRTRRTAPPRPKGPPVRY